ncbi:uncharacterized protein LOC124645754 [Helicoverpa zea]|uniref:uncharacterized protein LOC124645754 n=1 Tax=Helicoverpa zea TaxID=7113 RepID=UPI001F59A5CB|nr:uncharacterized protein LOC124645754 [Helicoverpa zea]XP_049708342.1 uncharacterized protein LOC126057072 [Helicoverpa armigera]
MDVHTANENIRKIEDIIDIQKANGNFNTRQVAFNLPSESDSTVSANLAKSLESGLSKSKSESDNKKKFKKLRSKRHKSPLPDVISWPSDSDITVLRMKLCLTSSDLKEKVGNLIPGDGLHQPDSSSMVNLATLIRQSQTPSKHSFNIEEYLLPLTSWEREQDQDVEEEPEKEEPIVEEEQPNDIAAKFKRDFAVYEARCSHDHNENLSSKDSQSGYSKITKKSKLARFLRLYFCPCCTCLYRLEKMRDEPSAYFTNRKET